MINQWHTASVYAIKSPAKCLAFDVINSYSPHPLDFERLRLAVMTVERRLLLPSLLTTGVCRRLCASAVTVIGQDVTFLARYSSRPCMHLFLLIKKQHSQNGSPTAQYDIPTAYVFRIA